MWCSFLLLLLQHFLIWLVINKHIPKIFCCIFPPKRQTKSSSGSSWPILDFTGTLNCCGGHARCSTHLLFTLTLSSSGPPPPPSARHSFVPNTHNAFKNGFHFPAEERKMRMRLSTGRPSILPLGGPGLSTLSDCQHPKPGAPRNLGKSHRALCTGNEFTSLPCSSAPYP